MAVKQTQAKTETPLKCVVFSDGRRIPERFTLIRGDVHVPVLRLRKSTIYSSWFAPDRLERMILDAHADEKLMHVRCARPRGRGFVTEGEGTPFVSDALPMTPLRERDATGPCSGTSDDGEDAGDSSAPSASARQSPPPLRSVAIDLRPTLCNDARRELNRTLLLREYQDRYRVVCMKRETNIAVPELDEEKRTISLAIQNLECETCGHETQKNDREDIERVLDVTRAVDCASASRLHELGASNRLIRSLAYELVRVLPGWYVNRNRVRSFRDAMRCRNAIASHMPHEMWDATLKAVVVEPMFREGGGILQNVSGVCHMNLAFAYMLYRSHRSNKSREKICAFFDVSPFHANELAAVASRSCLNEQTRPDPSAP